MRGGNTYKQEIHESIAQCKVFVPILSNQVQEDLRNETWRFYKDEEWVLAQAHCNTSNLCVVPVRLPGYDERSTENHAKLPECIQSRTVFDIERQHIDTLIEIIHNMLNR